MPVNQGVSAPWSPPPCRLDGIHHTAGFGSTHSPTLLTSFVGEWTFVGEFGVSFVGAITLYLPTMLILPKSNAYFSYSTVSKTELRSKSLSNSLQIQVDNNASSSSSHFTSHQSRSKLCQNSSSEVKNKIDPSFSAQ